MHTNTHMHTIRNYSLSYIFFFFFIIHLFLLYFYYRKLSLIAFLFLSHSCKDFHFFLNFHLYSFLHFFFLYIFFQYFYKSFLLYFLFIFNHHNHACLVKFFIHFLFLLIIFNELFTSFSLSLLCARVLSLFLSLSLSLKSKLISYNLCFSIVLNKYLCIFFLFFPKYIFIHLFDNYENRNKKQTSEVSLPINRGRNGW